MVMTEPAPDITFRQLEVLVAVARCGSFGAAAGHLGISQASVSKHVMALERACEAKLFTRSAGQSSRLTAHGEELLNFAETTLAGYRRVRRMERSRSARTVVQIAASEATIDLNFHPHLANFCVQHPNIEIRFIPVVSALNVLPGLIEQKVDIAFLALAEKPDHVSGRLLGEIQFGLYANPELAARIRSGGDEAKPYPIVWPPHGGPVSRILARAIREAELQPYEVVRTLQRLSTGVDLARLGVGICCITQVQARPFVESGELEKVGAISGIYSYAIPLGSQQDASTAAALEYFARALLRDLVEH